MESVCVEERNINKHTREGLRILAQIIARDLIANQVLNGDCENDSANEYLQDK